MEMGDCLIDSTRSSGSAALAVAVALWKLANPWTVVSAGLAVACSAWASQRPGPAGCQPMNVKALRWRRFVLRLIMRRKWWRLGTVLKDLKAQL